MPQGDLPLCYPFLLTLPCLLPAIHACAAIHAGRRPPLLAEGHPYPERPPTVAQPPCTPHPPRLAEGVVPSTPARGQPSAERTTEGGRDERPRSPRTFSCAFCDPLRSFSSGEASMLRGSSGPVFLSGDRLALAAKQGWGSTGLIPSFRDGGEGRIGGESAHPEVPEKRSRRARPGLTLPRGASRPGLSAISPPAQRFVPSRLFSRFFDRDSPGTERSDKSGANLLSPESGPGERLRRSRSGPGLAPGSPFRDGLGRRGRGRGVGDRSPRERKGHRRGRPFRPGDKAAAPG